MEECMVSVFCTTYNHKKYISRCLDSLANQKTPFFYEIIVRDDASTDGTSDIVREYAERYPDKVIPFIQPENLYQRGLSHISYEKMFRMSRGKYIAICEGDDFWMDENKLRKQVDFMESHPDYSLCGHAAYYATEDGSLLTDRFFRLSKSSGELTTEEIISSWTMATCSLLYRKSSRTDIIIPFLGKCINGDFAQMVYFSLKGKVYYSDELMGAYRLCSSGSISQKLRTDSAYLQKRRLEFVEMLDRIDDYTRGKYADALKKRKTGVLFDLYLNLGDAENVRKYKEALRTAGFKTRMRYYLCVYFHPLFSFIDKTYHRIKNK